MARRKQTQIRTVSYIHVGNKLVCTDDLTPQQKYYVGTLLKQQILNAFYQGKAEFGLPEGFPTREEVFGRMGLDDEEETDT